jgi:hypothetical protein
MMTRTPVIVDVNPDPDALVWEQDFLTRLDAAVIQCRGPNEPGGCPLENGLPCPKLEAADGVIFQLDLDIPEHRGLLARYGKLLEVPVRAVVTQDQKVRHAHLLESFEVFTPPIGPATLDAFEAEVESEL